MLSNRCRSHVNDIPSSLRYILTARMAICIPLHVMSLRAAAVQFVLLRVQCVLILLWQRISCEKNNLFLVIVCGNFRLFRYRSLSGVNFSILCLTRDFIHQCQAPYKSHRKWRTRNHGNSNTSNKMAAQQTPPTSHRISATITTA